MTCRLIGSLAIALSLSAGLARADTAPFNAARWLNWHNNYGSLSFDIKRCHASDAELAQWDQTFHQVGRDLAAQAPTPPGALYGTVRQVTSIGEDCSQVRTAVELAFVPPADTERVPSRTRPGQFWIRPKRTSGSLTLKFNTLPDVAQVGQTSGPGPVQTYCWTLQSGTLDGYPIYDNRYLVITAGGHPPPLLPVPAEKYLTWFIAKLNTDLAEAVRMDEEMFKVVHQHMDLSGLDQVREQISHAKAQLAHLGAAERSAPAYTTLAAQMDGAALVKPGPESYSVVTTNAAYFDSKLPRGTPQLLVVDLGNIDSPTAPSGSAAPDSPEAAMGAYARKADWHRIAKFLK